MKSEELMNENVEGYKPIYSHKMFLPLERNARQNIYYRHILKLDLN